jgi:GH15 family glucan-1,4-alpha-glucosidase
VSQLIEDYAIVGDTQTAALIGRDGSVDWLCVPRFDSGSCFAKLLGTEDHGRWLLAPEAEVTDSKRSYRAGTLVLETELTTAGGVVRIVEWMPPRQHHPRLVRLVQGVKGEVKMQTELVVRFEYGTEIPWVRFDEGLHMVAGPNALSLQTSVPLEGRNMHSEGHWTVKAGEETAFVLSWYPSHRDAPERLDTDNSLEATVKYWSDFSKTIHKVHGQWEDAVRRSLITLKALTYAPTGGIVAAATTSLPEAIGGVRNWDYRYCWVRDATLTLDALIEAGCREEAEAWMRWLVRAAAGAPEQLQIMYGAAGERRLTEFEVDWLPGYEGSAPVRVGNAASGQFQLDVYGELMDAVDRARSHHKIDLLPIVWDLQLQLMEFVSEHWQDPDDGIWEVRGPRRHFTHSKVMAWVAFDRAVKSVEQHGLDGPVDDWRRARDAVHDQVCQEGYSADRRAFTQYYGAKDLDASILMLPLVGFLPPDDPRVVSTVDLIQEELLVDGFVLRYQNTSGVDGLPGTEGAFLPCTFWLADCLALMGRIDEAEKIFTRLAALANDVGLLSEEYDAKESRLLGNFPQAFTHVGLINTARNLTAARKRQ